MSWPCRYRVSRWRSFVVACLVVTAMAGCHAAPDVGGPASEHTLERIEREVQAYALPGHATVLFDRSGVVVERYEGAADLESGRPVTAATLFPVASLTKTWSAVIVLQLVGEGVLRLDQPVVELLPAAPLPRSVQVAHLLSHTSHGTPGESFHYDGRRFGVLGRIIETVSGESFAEAMQRRIIEPLDLRDTFLIGDSADDTRRHDELALPYSGDGRHERCDIEYGHSASAGLVSTARDVATFNRALLRGELLSPAQLALIVNPYSPDVSTGLGSFVQEVDGRRLVWAYGQYDCHAALTVMDAASGSGLVFLANSNTPSDSARLLYGDVLASPIALAWLGMPVDSMSQARAALLRDVFLSRSHPDRLGTAIDAASRFLDAYPDEQRTADLVAVHALVSLKDVAWRLQQRRLTQFDTVIEAKASAVLSRDGGNPYAHYYLASLYATQNRPEQARTHFQAIVSASNTTRSWYTQEAEAFLSGTAE